MIYAINVNRDRGFWFPDSWKLPSAVAKPRQLPESFIAIRKKVFTSFMVNELETNLPDVLKTISSFLYCVGNRRRKNFRNFSPCICTLIQLSPSPCALFLRLCIHDEEDALKWVITFLVSFLLRTDLKITCALSAIVDASIDKRQCCGADTEEVPVGEIGCNLLVSIGRCRVNDWFWNKQLCLK